MSWEQQEKQRIEKVNNDSNWLNHKRQTESKSGQDLPMWVFYLAFFGFILWAIFGD